MDIADAGFVERGGELAFGKARPARGRDRARIDQQVDFGALEFVHHRGGLGLLVADREQRLRFRCLDLSFGGFISVVSISAMAAAGARNFASWMK